MKLLLENIKVHLIKGELEKSPDLWNKNTLRTAYEGSPHKEADDIWLRFRDLDDMKSMSPQEFCNKPYEPVWYDTVQRMPHTKKIIERVCQLVDCDELGACLITRIPPGGKVAKHQDINYNSQHYLNKYLIVVQSHPKQVFRHNGKDYSTQAGDLWLFDNRLPHEVINDSDVDRISLIISVKQAAQKVAA